MKRACRKQATVARAIKRTLDLVTAEPPQPADTTALSDHLCEAVLQRFSCLPLSSQELFQSTIAAAKATLDAHANDDDETRSTWLVNLAIKVAAERIRWELQAASFTPTPVRALPRHAFTLQRMRDHVRSKANPELTAFFERKIAH